MATLLFGLSCSQTLSLDSLESNRTGQAVPVPADSSSQVERLADIEPGQICVINANIEEAEEMERAVQPNGFAKKKRRVLEQLGFVMSILQVPEGQTVRQGIADLRQQFPAYVIDANHRHRLLGQESESDLRLYGKRLIGWNNKAYQCGADIRLGIVDTAVNLSHQALQPQQIRTRSFLSDSTPQAPNQHGTAVATLLVGKPSTAGSGLLPNAHLLVAEAFRQSTTGRVEANTWTILRALNWLAKERVQVINLSLGGPQNGLLAMGIKRILEQGIPIVAAAGNSGPQGNPTYPAAQEGVIAVTALDAKLKPYVHATRGSYITFSAPGVDIWVPTGERTGIFQSGTSFATPFVTSAVAALKLSNPQWQPGRIAQELAARSLDLGSSGKDEVFGWGLIQFPHTCTKQSVMGNVAEPNSLNLSAHCLL